jgi:CheY-like chemotaxis protein/signal transduction histidine kinase
MINNVLDVAKINAEKLELHYSPGNFLKLIEKVWSVSTLKMKQKDLHGELYISQTFPKYVNMDSHRLLQILLNFLGNSAKFTSKGFIKVIVNWFEDGDSKKLSKPHEEYTRLVPKSFEISEEKSGIEEFKLAARQGSGLLDPANSNEFGFEGSRKVDLSNESTNRYLHPKFLSEILASQCLYLTTDEHKLHKNKNKKKKDQKKEGIIKIDIIDTGCGIPSQTLPELFKPFQQADSSVAQRYGGTGLGLYISQELIQKMGGKINVYSQENVGSNFSILIPATTATKQETKDKECEEENENEFRQKIASAHLRALIVDHDPINRSTFISYLKKLRVQVDEVCTGQDALNKLIEKGIQYYSFISIDLQLPDINGMNTCVKIREIERNMRFENLIPIIVVTGNCSEQERIKCVDPMGDIRAMTFHQKPFTFKDCKLAIQTIFRKQKCKDAKGQKILVVDDDPFNTTVAEKFLKKNGFECDICYNGQEAVNKVAKEKYYAILMDCEMPEMDGFTAARLIRQKNPDLLIIGVTGHSEEACLNKARRNGMTVVETKPLNMKKIIGLLFKQTILEDSPASIC